MVRAATGASASPVIALPPVPLFLPEPKGRGLRIKRARRDGGTATPCTDRQTRLTDAASALDLAAAAAGPVAAAQGLLTAPPVRAFAWTDRPAPTPIRHGPIKTVAGYPLPIAPPSGPLASESGGWVAMGTGGQHPVVWRAAQPGAEAAEWAGLCARLWCAPVPVALPAPTHDAGWDAGFLGWEGWRHPIPLSGDAPSIVELWSFEAASLTMPPGTHGLRVTLWKPPRPIAAPDAVIPEAEPGPAPPPPLELGSEGSSVSVNVLLQGGDTVCLAAAFGAPPRTLLLLSKTPILRLALTTSDLVSDTCSLRACALSVARRDPRLPTLPFTQLHRPQLVLAGARGLLPTPSNPLS
jgi:hypothetical protein